MVGEQSLLTADSLFTSPSPPATRHQTLATGHRSPVTSLQSLQTAHWKPPAIDFSQLTLSPVTFSIDSASYSLFTVEKFRRICRGHLPGVFENEAMDR